MTGLPGVTLTANKSRADAKISVLPEALIPAMNVFAFLIASGS